MNARHLKNCVKNLNQQRINILHCFASLSGLPEGAQVCRVQAGVLEVLNANFLSKEILVCT